LPKFRDSPRATSDPIRKRIYKTRDLARADIFDYIEVFYNRTRRHSHIGGVSPEAFETAAA
jgi:putative transposase